jgi:hypothetical protein
MISIHSQILLLNDLFQHMIVCQNQECKRILLCFLSYSLSANAELAGVYSYGKNFAQQ